MDADRLKKLPLFEELPQKDLERIATWADEVDVPEGKHLTEEGAFGREFFVIEVGTAKVEHEGKVIAELGPGDYFGELALLDDDRRSASVRTLEKSTFTIIFKDIRLHRRRIGRHYVRHPLVRAWL